LIEELREEAVAYLQKKTDSMKELGVEKVSYLAEYGVAADEIISLGKDLGQSYRDAHTGPFRSPTLGIRQCNETVVRRSGDPVLVIRPTD
jgi:hypothetical protein